MSYCNWDNASELCLRYHNSEWGVPLHDDIGQFEFLMMEVMQCGLNWNMMMTKREIFRKCFDGFDYNRVAAYDEADIIRIMNTPGMIRSRRKIEAIIHNAKCFLEIRKEFGSFCTYLWNYSNGKTILYDKHPEGFIPASNGLSDRISRDLRQRGFKYLGSITVYSHLQAAGIINDHDANCPRHAAINAIAHTVRKRRDHEQNVQYFGDAP